MAIALDEPGKLFDFTVALTRLSIHGNLERLQRVSISSLNTILRPGVEQW